VRRPEIAAALKRCTSVFMPAASQDPDGTVTVSLGAKGVVELELVASGEKWGRGPKKDVHSSNRARLDSPAFHLVQALATLVNADGDPAIDGFADAVRRPRRRSARSFDTAAARLNETPRSACFSADRWAHDLAWRPSLERFLFTPTVNIEGLVAGYTGPGGKTVLPHRAVAKLDLRLVPDMTYDGAVAALKAHLAKRGFGDVEVNPSGGYDPTSTDADHAGDPRRALGLPAAPTSTPILWPRNAGSYPGYVFTGEPLKLPAGHFGLGHGSGAHAPDEYVVIESSNPKVMGWDGAVRSFVDYCTSSRPSPEGVSGKTTGLRVGADPGVRASRGSACPAGGMATVCTISLPGLRRPPGGRGRRRGGGRAPRSPHALAAASDGR